MKGLIVLLICQLALVGCATEQSNIASLIGRQQVLMHAVRAAPNDEANRVAKAEVDQALDAKLMEEIAETNRVCSDVVGNRERLAEERSKKTLYLSLVGLAAGSIIAPALTSANAAANAPWISAFSGLGGASSLAVRQVDGAGFSGAADVTVINGIVEEVKKQMNIALNTTEPPSKRYSAAIAARNECLYFPRVQFVIVNDKPSGGQKPNGAGGAGAAGAGAGGG